MAQTIPTSTTDVISLDEFCEYVREEVDICDLDSVAESAEAFRSLANNRGFLAEKLNRELEGWRDFQAVNEYTPQTLMLGGGKGWYVRANIWTPPSHTPELLQWQDEYYSYLRPHDHNFSFLTVGYFGGGYETVIYEYDPEEVEGIPGEPVELRFLERTALTQGKVMMYRASRDVHRQEPPKDFSISLNLMTSPPQTSVSNQYYFDLEKGQISQFVRNSSTSRIMICRLAGFVGDGNTASLLHGLAANSASPRVRAASTEAFAKLVPDAAVQAWERAAQDSDPFVRQAAVAELTKRQSA